MGIADGTARHRASTAAVLEFAWDARGFRADHVIATLGLTRSTTLSALDTLIGIGLIRELEGVDADDGYRVGRPARRFELRGEAGLVIGIDAGGHHFTAVAADLAGRILAREQVEVLSYNAAAGSAPPQPDPEERRAVAFGAIDAVLASAGHTRDDVIGLAIGIPAPVDGRGISPPHGPNFWPRMNADLQRTLDAVFPVVRVENDAALAALAEGSLGAARQSDDFVAMLVGRRLGSGVVVDGRLIRGAHGGIGELEGLSYVSGAGGTWGLGHRVEEWIRAALDEGRVPDGHPWTRLSRDGLTAETVLAGARLSDPISRPLLEEMGSMLGRICSVVSRFYDPELIVVCGAMADGLDEIIQIARDQLATELELPPPAIVPSGLAGDVVSLGAVAAAREAAREIVLPLLTERRGT